LGKEYGLVPVFCSPHNVQQEVGIAGENGMTEIRIDNSTQSRKSPS